MKGKIGEALAAGLPVVTTRVGAEGMDLEDGATAMIADSPNAFAEAVVRICSDPQLHGRLSEAGRVHVRRRWGMPTVEGQLIEAIESVRRMRPKALRGSERIAARLRHAYVRSGLARIAERAKSVATWYLRRVYRFLGRQ